MLDGGADVQDVAVADDILLPFQAHLPALARLGLRPGRHEFLVVDHFGPDEPALEVRVDLPGGAGSAITFTGTIADINTALKTAGLSDTVKSGKNPAFNIDMR